MQTKSLGVYLSIDDFGYQVTLLLNILKSLPNSRLKIDQSFVRDFIKDKQRQAYCSCLFMRWPKALNIEACYAEG